MSKRKKLIIGLASILLLASLILIIVWFLKNRKSELEIKLTDIAVDYYENDYKKIYPNALKQWGTFKVDLDGLKGNEKDVSYFEEHNCDLEETYVILTYKNESSYDIDVHLACEE